MTRSWNQTKNSNLRHIATGYLRTYKSKNSREAIATVRIARDNKHIYIHIYIYGHHWMNAQESHGWNLFCSAKLKHGGFGSLQTEWNKTDSPWCPLSLLDSFFEVSQIEIPFQTNEALCFANFSPLVPHFLQLCTSFVFFFGLLYLLKLSGTERTECRNFSALWKQRKQFFHFPRDGRSATLQGESTLQFQGRHGPLESNFQELPKVLSWSLRCYIPWSKHQGHLGYLWKRETPSTVQTTAPQMPCDALCIHLCLSNWMDLWSALPRIHNTFWNVRTKRLNHTSIIGVENDSANGANNLVARARFTCTTRENYTWKLRPFHLKGPRDAVFFCTCLKGYAWHPAALLTT